MERFNFQLHHNKSALSFEVNNDENWRCWFQNLIATEQVDRHEKIKCALLLHCAGEQAIEVFNTFDVEEDNKDKYTYLVEQFTQHIKGKKTLL